MLSTYSRTAVFSGRYPGLGSVPEFVALSDVFQRTYLRREFYMPSRIRFLANVLVYVGFAVIVNYSHTYEGFLWGSFIWLLCIWFRAPRHKRQRLVRRPTSARDPGDLVLWHAVDDPYGRSLLEEGEKLHRFFSELVRLSQINGQHADQLQTVFSCAGAISALESRARVLWSSFQVVSAVNPRQAYALQELLSGALDQARKLKTRQVAYFRPLNRHYGVSSRSS